jgi:transcriptional regulator with XRE-family HTH domain
MDARLFGRRLRAARIATGFERPEDFASVLRVEIALYLRLEAGTFVPADLDLGILEDISRLTGHTLDFFVMGRSAESAATR